MSFSVVRAAMFSISHRFTTSGSLAIMTCATFCMCCSASVWSPRQGKLTVGLPSSGATPSQRNSALKVMTVRRLLSTRRSSPRAVCVEIDITITDRISARARVVGQDMQNSSKSIRLSSGAILDGQLAWPNTISQVIGGIQTNRISATKRVRWLVTQPLSSRSSAFTRAPGAIGRGRCAMSLCRPPG